MVELIRTFFLQLSQEKKVVASVCALLGWFNNLLIFDLGKFTWEYFIKGFAGLCMSVITLAVGLVFKDYYAIKLKPKIFKNEKRKEKTERSKDEKAA